MTQNPAERKALLTALVDHVLPAIDGVGGVTAGVPEYLQQLLLSKHAADYYELIDWGMQCINDEHQYRFGKGFSEGERQQCIELLREFTESEDRHYQMFWRTLIRLCLEGFLAHPRNGGNRDTQGWRAIGYPGCADRDVSLSLINSG